MNKFIVSLSLLLAACVTDGGVTQSSSVPQNDSRYLRADGRPVVEGHLRSILPQCQQEEHRARTEFVTAGAPVPFFAGMATSQSAGDTAMAACMGRNGYYLAQ
jgi:hypothetical protein